MRRRVKKLLAIVLSCILFIQMFPMQARAVVTISGETVLVTVDDLGAGTFEIGSDGTLQFDEGLTIDDNVYFVDYSSSNLIIPSTSTMNGSIAGFNTNSKIQNSGTITSAIDLSSGVLENRGYVSEVVVSSGGMLKSYEGASYDTLNLNSGNAITEGTCSVGTLFISPDALSSESSTTIFNVEDAVSFTGFSDFNGEKFKVVVSDTTAISTTGATMLYVWKDDVQYPLLPDIEITGKTLNDIYSVSIDKRAFLFDEQAIGYQTAEKASFKVENNGLYDLVLQLDTSGEWDSMFTLTPSENVDVDESEGGTYYYIASNDTGTFEAQLKTGLSVDTHSGSLGITCYKPNGDIYETYEVSSDVTVAVKPSLPAPSGDFYACSGTEGENGFYTSDVIVTPMEGYLIAESLDDAFATSLTFTETAEGASVYLQNEETGQITEQAVLEDIKIDKSEPEITGCENNQTYKEDSLVITIMDKNLSSVTLNGEEQTTQGQTATVTVTAGLETTEYTLVAKDLAGHTKTVTFSLVPMWKASIDTTKLSYDELAVGYQTAVQKQFIVTNASGDAIEIGVAATGEWDKMFKVTSSGKEVTDEAKISVAAGTTAVFDVALNKGLSVATHNGALSLKCYASDGTLFETFEVSGSVVVAKKPSLDAPTGDFYSFSGTEGKNGFYTSDVKVTLADGYSIAKTLSDEFSKTVTYTESIAKPTVYLQKDSTGQITKKVTLEKILIDKDKPVVKNASSGKTYYQKALKVTISDDNLSSVTLNGTAVDVSDGKAEMNLAASDGKDKYTLKAEDKAGNSKVVTFYMAPEWMKEGTVPNGREVQLYKDTPYNFGSGTWTVSGDTTNYAGGVTFYVENDGRYTFQTGN